MKTIRTIVPLIWLFVFFNTFFVVGRDFISKFTLDYKVLFAANLLFFFLSVIVFLMQKKARGNSNPNVYFRTVMGGMMIKMAITIIAVVAYVLAFKNTFSKFSVFASMFLYLFYLAAEVKVSNTLNKEKNA